MSSIWITLFFFNLDYCLCGSDTKSFVFLLQRTASPVSVFRHDYQLPFPKGEVWPSADRCCISPEKFFWCLSKARLVPRSELYQAPCCAFLTSLQSIGDWQDFVPRLLMTGMRPEFESRELWNKHIVLLLWHKFNLSGIFSEVFSCCCVRNGLFTKQLGRKWTGSHRPNTLGSKIHCLVNGCSSAGFWRLIHLWQQIYRALVPVSGSRFLVQGLFWKAREDCCQKYTASFIYIHICQF